MTTAVTREDKLRLGEQMARLLANWYLQKETAEPENSAATSKNTSAGGARRVRDQQPT